MQGGSTFSVESIIGSTIPENGKLLVLVNGAYGDRIALIAKTLKINTIVHDSGVISPPYLGKLENTLEQDKGITHGVLVHWETTTGMLNPMEKIWKDLFCRYDEKFRRSSYGYRGTEYFLREQCKQVYTRRSWLRFYLCKNR